MHNTKYCPFCLFFRLALYVYEYLLHVGAQKSAQTFLSEVCGRGEDGNPEHCLWWL
uniref:LisH domain-containing protein n=1 Tax=Strix occidentalis caurina TaxID=311401 RepID=A0A8D0FJY9_STROC